MIRSNWKELGTERPLQITMTSEGRYSIEVNVPNYELLPEDHQELETRLRKAIDIAINQQDNDQRMSERLNQIVKDVTPYMYKVLDELSSDIDHSYSYYGTFASTEHFALDNAMPMEGDMITVEGHLLLYDGKAWHDIEAS